jgi:hypothetical protein
VGAVPGPLFVRRRWVGDLFFLLAAVAPAREGYVFRFCFERPVDRTSLSFVFRFFEGRCSVLFFSDPLGFLACLSVGEVVEAPVPSPCLDALGVAGLPRVEGLSGGDVDPGVRWIRGCAGGSRPANRGWLWGRCSRGRGRIPSGRGRGWRRSGSLVFVRGSGRSRPDLRRSLSHGREVPLPPRASGGVWTEVGPEMPWAALVSGTEAP